MNPAKNSANVPPDSSSYSCRIEWSGDLAPGQLTVEWSPTSVQPPIEVDRAIDRAWAVASVQAGRCLFDGPMCRLESWHSAANNLHLLLAPTSYRRFWGTNLCHPELADRLGAGALANPLGLSAALLSADGMLLMGRRNAAVAYYPNRVHPFAGAMEPRDLPDVFGAVRRELSEELSLGPNDITDMRCIGLVRDTSLRQPELIVHLSSPMTAAQIDTRVDGGEHYGLWTVPLTPVAFDDALRDRTELTPVALATLLLTGRRHFGERWFAAHYQ